MANVLVVVSFGFGLLVYFGSKVDAVIGRALFCRDPDTGKLHPPNTTWPSTTFCGNYTCKIRKRNTTDTRHLEATEIQNNETLRIENYNKIQEHAPNTLDHLVAVPSHKGDQSVNDNQKYDKDYKIAQIEKAIKSGDRYLTEDEIKTLSNLLHTVKKSDLEAIIDIYNLAQDIYNEMNRSTIDDILTDHGKYRGYPGSGLIDDVGDKKHSYWYEPLRNGMLKESTDTMAFIPTIATKVEHDTKKYPPFPSILTNQDFRQLPYYQSIPDYSNRLYSFYQQLHQKGQQTEVQRAQLTQLTDLPIRPMVPFQMITTPNYQDPFWVKKRASLQKLKLIQPPLLGTGPMHAYRGNIPNVPKVFYYGLEVQNKAIPTASPLPVQPLVQHLTPGQGPNPNLDPGYYRRQKPNEVFQQNTVKGPPPPQKRRPFPNNAVLQPLPKAVLENPFLHDDVRAFEQQQVIHPKRSNIIHQLLRQELSSREIIASAVPTSVITEIRANVIEPQKPMMSQYRKLSLRKVGRLVNLKDLFRIKRQIDNKDMSTDEEYEAYVERKTCDLDTDPGFFRKGNESDVYPRCCPQRIQRR